MQSLTFSALHFCLLAVTCGIHDRDLPKWREHQQVLSTRDDAIRPAVYGKLEKYVIVLIAAGPNHLRDRRARLPLLVYAIAHLVSKMNDVEIAPLLSLWLLT